MNVLNVGKDLLGKKVVICMKQSMLESFYVQEKSRRSRMNNIKVSKYLNSDDKSTVTTNHVDIGGSALRRTKCS